MKYFDIYKINPNSEKDIIIPATESGKKKNSFSSSERMSNAFTNLVISSSGPGPDKIPDHNNLVNKYCCHSYKLYC